MNEADPARLEEQPDRDAEERRRVLRRIRIGSILAWAIFALALGISGGWRAVLGLTCTAAVVIINFLWLEEIVRETLQSAPQVKAWRVFVRVLLRFALLGLALTVTIIIARFEALSVTLGFSVIVVGIAAEALRSVVMTLRGEAAGEDNDQ